MFGDVEITSATFRFPNLSRDDRYRAVLDMIRAILAFFHDRPEDGATLAHNGERIILQRLKGQPVMFDSEGKEYATPADDPELDRIQESYLVTPLPQPYL